MLDTEKAIKLLLVSPAELLIKAERYQPIGRRLTKFERAKLERKFRRTPVIITHESSARVFSKKCETLEDQIYDALIFTQVRSQILVNE